MSIAIFLLTMVNVISFSMMKEPKISYVNDEGKEMHGHLARDAQRRYPRLGVQWRKELQAAFRDKRFKKALMVNCLWMTAFYIANPFNASYQLKELGLPYTFIMGETEAGCFPLPPPLQP